MVITVISIFTYFSSLFLFFVFLQTKHFPFINCVEDMVHHDRSKKWKSCFRKLKLNPNPIENCTRGEIGKQVSSITFLFLWFSFFCLGVKNILFPKRY